VLTAESAREGLELMERETFDLLLTDLRMPVTDGIKLLEEARALDPEMLVIIFTAYGTVETAVEAMKKGAQDYITKPLTSVELRLVVERVLRQRALLLENRILRHSLGARGDFSTIIGRSPAMQEVFRFVQKVAGTDSTVLISGESGTGKELVAWAIHRNGPRKDRPFVPINCGSLAETVLESELFGHARGAFTGAFTSRRGFFEAAAGGTLFLDEVGDMSLAMQAKLLRTLQDRAIYRVGDTRRIPVDVRIIAATNKDLASEVAAKRFREDLYYRLNVVPVRLPPLRKRIEDLPPLVDHCLRKARERTGKPVTEVAPEALSGMALYTWPGNVRELENVIERAVILAEGQVITPKDLPFQLLDPVGPAAALETAGSRLTEDLNFREIVRTLEMRLIREALARTQGNAAEAARLLGLSRSTLRDIMRKLQM
jgi:DNA-binding NtrC family response regulator